MASSLPWHEYKLKSLLLDQVSAGAGKNQSGRRTKTTKRTRRSRGSRLPQPLQPIQELPSPSCLSLWPELSEDTLTGRMDFHLTFPQGSLHPSSFSLHSPHPAEPDKINRLDKMRIFCSLQYDSKLEQERRKCHCLFVKPEIYR